MMDFLNSDQRDAVKHCAEHGHSWGNATCMCCSWPAESIERNLRRQRDDLRQKHTELLTLLERAVKLPLPHCCCAGMDRCTCGNADAVRLRLDMKALMEKET